MGAFLISFGVICVAAAIIGGGLKARGIDVPVISSISRQLLLALFGLILLFSGLAKNGQSGHEIAKNGNKPDQRVAPAPSVTAPAPGPAAVTPFPSEQVTQSPPSELRGSLNQGATSSHEFPLVEQVTYDIRGSCDADCADLDLRLYEVGDSALVAGNSDPDNTPLLVRTPSRTGKHRLDVAMRKCIRNPCAYKVTISSR